MLHVFFNLYRTFHFSQSKIKSEAVLTLKYVYSFNFLHKYFDFAIVNIKFKCYNQYINFRRICYDL